MRKFIIAAAAASLAVTGVAGTAFAASSQTYAGAQYASQAKISLADARKIALAARPGVITDQELEKEKGGSGLRYSFDVKSNGKTYEVGVDAKTGKLLENSLEGPNAD